MEDSAEVRCAPCRRGHCHAVR